MTHLYFGHNSRSGGESRSSGYLSGVIVGVCACAIAAGCEGPPGNPMPEGDWRGESAAVLSRLAGDHEPVRTLAPAGERGRFEDAPLACYWAIAQDGVEMGLGETIETDDRYIFKLKTVEGWPATLTVERSSGEQIYQASAQVGRFPDMPERRERARELLDAFDEFMTALGKKKKLEERSELQ